MNQRSWQTTKNATEKDFYKLLSNANFGYDSRNNLDNCKFDSIYDEIGEITYIRKDHNLFENEVLKFVNSSLVEKQIEKTYNEKLLQIKNDNSFKNYKIEYLKTEKKNKWRSSTSIKTKRKKKHKKRAIKIFETRLDEANKNQKYNWFWWS